MTGEHLPGELNSGIEWSTDGHTAIPVPLFAYGPSAEQFTGVLDNTDIAKKISEILKLDMDFTAPLKNKKLKELVKN